MMRKDDFQTIYSILKFLKNSKQCEEFDRDNFNSNYFNITKSDFCATLEMLNDRNFIKGIEVSYGLDGNKLLCISNPRITLSGLEYLETNALMIKSAKEARGIIE